MKNLFSSIKCLTLAILLALSISSFGQTKEFNFYGLKNNISDGSVIPVNAKLVISKNKNKYTIEQYDPRDGTLALSSTFEYKSFNDIDNEYLYYGTLIMGVNKYKCFINTKTKMSSFIAGEANKNRYYYYGIYEIKFYYWNYNEDEPLFKQYLSLYPTILKEATDNTAKNNDLSNENIEINENEKSNIYEDNKINDTTIKNDLNEFKLKGKVKTLTESHFSDVQYKNIYIFDEKGYKIEETDGNWCDFRIIYKYDDKNNMIEENIYNSNGTLFNEWTYNYDNKGNRIEEYKYNPDKSLNYKSTYKYDNKGNKIEANFYKSDGKLDGKSTFKYDEKGNMIEENNYNEYDRLENKTIYRYDNKGNKIEKKFNDLNSNIHNKTTYKYDAKGNLIEETSYNSNGKLNEKSTYSYIFDKKNNWIKKTGLINGNPDSIEKREIIYY